MAKDDDKNKDKDNENESGGDDNVTTQVEGGCNPQFASGVPWPCVMDLVTMVRTGTLFDDLPRTLTTVSWIAGSVAQNWQGSAPENVAHSMGAATEGDCLKYLEELTPPEDSEVTTQANPIAMWAIQQLISMVLKRLSEKL